MPNPIKTLIRNALESQGYTIKRTGLGYIDAKRTIAAAQQAGLGVGDYVEQLWDKVGEGERVIQRILNHGGLPVRPDVLEIGPGTGRYLAKVLAHLTPQRYEIYETDPGWAGWLARSYPVLRQPADGHNLRATADASIDLVHAHGVFVYLPFLTVWRYWQEIWRVTRPGGMVAFDIFSEDCFTETDLQCWLDSGETYPCILPANYAIAAFQQAQFTLVERFLVPCCESRSEYLVFRRQA